jgi:hypothetical protein
MGKTANEETDHGAVNANREHNKRPEGSGQAQPKGCMNPDRRGGRVLNMRAGKRSSTQNSDKKGESEGHTAESHEAECRAKHNSALTTCLQFFSLFVLHRWGWRVKKLLYENHKTVLPLSSQGFRFRNPISKKPKKREQRSARYRQPPKSLYSP